VLLSNICSLTPVAPNFEPCPATVAYLVSCGASPATAAARKIRIRDDTDRADAVGELLREYGFSEAEVTRTIVNGGPDAPHLRSRTEPPPRARIPPPHASAARLPPPFFFSRVVLRASAQSAIPVNDAATTAPGVAAPATAAYKGVTARLPPALLLPSRPSRCLHPVLKVINRK
jgi:hypothetical protein